MGFARKYPVIMTQMLFSGGFVRGQVKFLLILAGWFYTL
jgi:hypothetical protein